MENTEQKIGPSRLIKKTELIKIIIQCQYSLGYEKSAESFENESRISWKSEEFKLLESHIRDENWDSCIDILDEILGVSNDSRNTALVAVFEQYLFDCLRSNKFSLALEVLREKVSRSRIGEENVQKLAHCLILEADMSRIEKLRKGLISKLEDILLEFPKGRLEYLVESFIDSKIANCLNHNSSDDVSLYRNHDCLQHYIPAKTIQILTNHEDRVRFVKFSNNGKYLASSSSDGTAIIWEVQDDNTVTLKHKLINRNKREISLLAWSPDDTMLLELGSLECSVHIWDAKTGLLKYKISRKNPRISYCAWFHDSKSVICFSEGKKGIFQWNCDNRAIISSWKNHMPWILDLDFTPDGKNLIGVFCDKTIRVWKISTTSEGIMNVKSELVISDQEYCDCLSISRDGQFLIFNFKSEEIHLWDFANNQWDNSICYGGFGTYVNCAMHCCFGGLECKYIASCGDDSKVYIWNRIMFDPIKVLSGHKKAVNCVSWNPKRHQMLASASDDRTIHIWGPSSISN